MRSLQDFSILVLGYSSEFEVGTVSDVLVLANQIVSYSMDGTVRLIKAWYFLNLKDICNYYIVREN